MPVKTDVEDVVTFQITPAMPSYLGCFSSLLSGPPAFVQRDGDLIVS